MLKKLSVLYEDDRCAVFNKPAGLAVQGGKGVGLSLDTLLAREWAGKPFLVHRLDQDTSGIILVAKSREAARYYASVMAERRARKSYLALCAGRPRSDAGTIDGDLVIRGVRKQSRTGYRLLAAEGDFSLLALELDTGRTHQIRRHLASLGLPVLGDGKYGDFALNKRLKKEQGLNRLLLHAAYLGIAGNREYRSLDLEAPLPDYFKTFLARVIDNRSAFFHDE
ncbi:MAG: RluA family pseudouridine synthase [Spirochaetaceae bacterium]|jgi:23S rRNA pseudouridine955/2504/2580 synthase|nr:RluA family pseudouridine synthase [Spirochaetaceae bacterium]